MTTFFKMVLVIHLTTSNVERGFPVINLICSPLRMPLRTYKVNLDCLIRICINGPNTFENSDVEKMVDIIKRSHDDRRLYM